MTVDSVAIHIKEHGSNVVNGRQHLDGDQQQRHCYICKNKNLPSNTQEIGPYLIHNTQPDLILICPCLHRVHPTCLKAMETDYICDICNSIYPHYSIRIIQFLCFLCHVLSLASAVGLVFGLSYLGRALDELGLGSEIGPKLDGDETWQDHEMLDIVEWLNIVHYATGAAGEALLGLVYIVGVCLVIGVDRTCIMISNILHVNLEKLNVLPKWLHNICIFVAFFLLGLVLGTYLLFFSWIWASVLRHLRKRLVDYQDK